MPTYQYACTECGHRFEQFQAFSDSSLTDCPVCTGKLRKVYGSVGVVFKGSGFYRTDSRAGAGAAVGGEKSEKSEKSDAAASTSADAGKAAAKEPSTTAAKSSESGSSSPGTSGNGSSTNGSATTKAAKAGKPAAAAKSGG